MAVRLVRAVTLQAWASDLATLGINDSCLLFSTDDLLIDAHAVRAFGDTLQAHSGRVDRQEWARSKHVQHFR